MNSYVKCLSDRRDFETSLIKLDVTHLISLSLNFYVEGGLFIYIIIIMTPQSDKKLT